jgi:hypothetical protein
MFACPMKVDRAVALTPAAISKAGVDMPCVIQGQAVKLEVSPALAGALSLRTDLTVAGEHPAVTGAVHPALEQVVAQYGRDRDVTAPLAALGVDLTLNGILSPADVDLALREVDVFPAQPDQLAAPQARVERGRPRRAICRIKRAETSAHFSERRADPHLAEGRQASGLLLTSPRATARL